MNEGEFELIEDLVYELCDIFEEEVLEKILDDLYA